MIKKSPRHFPIWKSWNESVNPAAWNESTIVPGYSYLLMEYVDGVNLRQAMRAGRETTLGVMALNRIRREPVCYKGHRLAKFATGFRPVATGITIVAGILLAIFWRATPGAYLTPLTQLLNFMLGSGTVLIGGIAIVIGVLVLVGILKLARGPGHRRPNHQVAGM